jgi:hypothetical protein
MSCGQKIPRENSVLHSTRGSNHALELTSARSVSTLSMATSLSPHLTLAPWIPFQALGFPSATPRTPAVLSSDEGGRSSACSR